MKRILLTALLVSLVAAVLLATPRSAVAPKTYQVTGPVLNLTNDLITVQKGTEKWEIGRDGSTKVTGDLKVGAKVTIEYRMTAATITVQPGAAAKPKTPPPPPKKGE